MKLYMIYLILIALFLHGCSSSTSPSWQNFPPFTFLSGQIDGWNYGDHRHIALCATDTSTSGPICSTSRIDLAGRFYLQNLASPPLSVQGFPSYAFENEPAPEVLENTVACSDSSAKIITGVLRVGNDSSSSWLGFVYRVGGNSDFFENSGDFVVNYYYARKNVKLIGAMKARTFGGSDSVRIERILQFDLSFEKGWNQEVIWFKSQSSYIDSGKTINSSVYSITNYEPYPGRWVYYAN